MALARETTDVLLAKVDATKEENKMMAQRFAVKGYPTMKLFKHGDEREYNGPKDNGDVSYKL